MTIKISVACLQVDDILIPTGRRVTSSPSVGIYTPRGKVDLCLDGKPVQYWKGTQVSVYRR